MIQDHKIKEEEIDHLHGDTYKKINGTHVDGEEDNEPVYVKPRNY
jgi:hypothetical protein